MKKEEKKYVYPSIIKIESLSEKLIIINRQLEEKNKLLEESELARKNMFSNITHDLRAPVAVIRGAVERLRQEGLGDKEQHKLISIIDSRAATLEHLIYDLHFSALLEQPVFELSPTRMEIAPFLEEYFISMESAGHLDGRKSGVSIPAGISTHAMIDLRYFLRVLDNLLENAIKHTKQGDLIEIGCLEDDGNAVIFFTDSGSGIPAGDLPYVFERTFTGMAARTPGKSGSGLGLSISRTIVEKHGGRIECSSISGKGTTFTIFLPLV